MSEQKIVYAVRPVTRYEVVRSAVEENGGSVLYKGEYDSEATALEVGTALCREEHRRLNWPIDDPRIQYPKGRTRLPPSLDEAAHEVDVAAFEADRRV